MKRTFIGKSRRIVIKIGSSLLILKDKFNYKWLQSFIEDIIFLKKKNMEVLIVASGAVPLGKKYLNIKKKKLKINEKQACAACGQVILMNNFKKAFEEKKIKIAQILLTYSDTEDRRKSLNSRETITELIKCGTVPIINENDSVATDELKFGDNDRLAARVSQIMSADNLILLSDVDGLFSKNPRKNRKAKFIPEVHKIDKRIFNMASEETNIYGTGGMYTKLQAAEIATNFGCNTIIFRGDKKNPIKSYIKANYGTWFVSKKKKSSSLKRWLAGTIKVSGNIMVDEGAFKALKKGASILPSGVQKISGKFSKGDIIGIEDLKGRNIGKGITYYDSDEVKILKGKKTSEIKYLLGYDGRDEIVHRDYLTLNE
ncbi:MAG: glutamate 5-kinase [Pseudomonadota bacterium]|nr:glutamate 5-kinase [Pseudomonadota bacterium]